MVAVSPDYKVYLRRRVELLDGSVPRFVYHSAAEMPLADAVRLIRSVEEIASAHAQSAMKDTIEHLQAANLVVTACGVAVGSTKLPVDLSAILRSHALIHAGEGALFQKGFGALHGTDSSAHPSYRSRSQHLDKAVVCAAADGCVEIDDLDLREGRESL